MDCVRYRIVLPDVGNVDHLFAGRYAAQNAIRWRLDQWLALARFSVRGRGVVRVACSRIVSKTGFKSPGDELMTLRTSEAAESCPNASSRSRVSCAASISLPAGAGPIFRAVFEALRRFADLGLRPRGFTDAPPALERRLIASLRLWVALTRLQWCDYSRDLRPTEWVLGIVCRQNISDIRFDILRECLAHLV
jgi:hypothetical protein